MAAKIFISYSHQDLRWKEELVVHLRPLVRSGSIEIWDTSDLKAGSDWAREISGALFTADIAVLLISAHFLASDFIVERELSAVLKRRQEEGLIVLPIIVEPSAWQVIPELAELQFANSPERPLSSMTAMDREKLYVTIVERIAELSQALHEDSTRRAGPSMMGRLKPGEVRNPEASGVEFFISHSRVDGDFAELLKLTLEREGYRAWVDVDRLGPGVDWREEIDEAIVRSAALIAIMSPEARESEYVTYEWAFAWGRKIKVLPIMLRPTGIHPRLGALQYLDFSNRLARPWSKLFQALDEARTRTSENASVEADTEEPAESTANQSAAADRKARFRSHSGR